MNRFKEIWNRNKGSIIVLSLYTLLFCIVSFFHEPWFDEAQAWEIGKTATYHEILTIIPHTEGHPPLWSLILSIPAKLGVPYYIGLKGASFAFSVFVVALIEFKSPFPRVFKYILPFTYFIFYQYGVISRTYCVMELSLVFVAITFAGRDEKPWRFIGSLYLLCLTSIYGIIIAAGICICWTYDILKETRREIIYIFKDIRVCCLFTLLIATILIVLLIIPAKNAYALNQINPSDLLKRLFYFSLIALGDSIVSFGGLPVWSSMSFFDIIPGLIVTISIIVLIFVISKRNNIKYYFVPSLLNCVFMSFYASGNHTGICMIWLISFLWATYDSEYALKKYHKFCKKTDQHLKSEGKIKVSLFVGFMPVVILMISMLYNIKVSIDEIHLPYSEAEEVAKYIKDYNMEEALIMVNWTTDNNDKLSSDDEEICEGDIFQSNNTFDAVAVLPYFEKNIFFNHNIKDHEKGYVSHLRLTKEKNEEIYKLWRDCGVPEVLLGLPALDLVYGNEVSIADYVSVTSMKGYYMGKNTPLTSIQHIYVRKDCLEKYGFKNF